MDGSVTIEEKGASDAGVFTDNRIDRRGGKFTWAFWQPRISRDFSVAINATYATSKRAVSRLADIMLGDRVRTAGMGSETGKTVSSNRFSATNHDLTNNGLRPMGLCVCQVPTTFSAVPAFTDTCISTR
ncbi:hypothetical protein QC763_102248 [Podospora pseudopauciseta]|uniref:Uncharacterized protein n=1 Tax=Podospora pseudopauciseta TaxID=2093780 RepID=A0ABR0HWS8_9PEZI|nr:hypothetical protein QC763_102248 [Podospora pseudopauciseta]